LEPIALNRRVRGAILRGECRNEPSQISTCGPQGKAQLRGIGVSNEAAQRLHDRTVRNPALSDVRAGASHDSHAPCFGGPRRLADEAALSNAGLAGDQEMRRRAEDGRVQAALDRAKFSLAPDKDGAAEATRHDLDHTHPSWRLGRRIRSGGDGSPEAQTFASRRTSRRRPTARVETASIRAGHDARSGRVSAAGRAAVASRRRSAIRS
jgi:hypothetical protein